jgi:hypothetical protein
MSFCVTERWIKTERAATVRAQRSIAGGQGYSSAGAKQEAKLLYFAGSIIHVRSEFFTAVTMKNVIF